jgi:hypothetical protein
LLKHFIRLLRAKLVPYFKGTDLVATVCNGIFGFFDFPFSHFVALPLLSPHFFYVHFLSFPLLFYYLVTAKKVAVFSEWKAFASCKL